MSNTTIPIKIRRGNKSNLPAASTTTAGELRYTLDAHELYVDDGTNNVLLSTPDQTSNSDKFLTTDGTVSSWTDIDSSKLVGSWHEVATEADRNNILARYRKAGMAVRVLENNTTYILNSDLASWTALNNVSPSEVAAAVAAEAQIRLEQDTLLENKKANSADLATVATSGSYNDLSNKPTIGNATLTIKKNSTDIGTFTANATSNVDINVTVPTNNNELTNGANYQNATQVSASIASHNTNSSSHEDIRESIDDINSKIPIQATYVNQLADKEFVNSSIQSQTAAFDGNWNTYAAVPSTVAGFTDLGLPEPSINNYLVITADETHSGETWRYKYTGALGTTYDKTKWIAEYKINNTAFTAAQIAALNSTITIEKVEDYTSHLTNTGNPHNVTKTQVGLSNVDNTSDVNKPISSATQVALNAKQDVIDDLSTIRSGATAGSTAVQPSQLSTVATTGSYGDLSDKPTIGNATLTISKNTVAIDTFNANATVNKNINISVPTKISDLTDDTATYPVDKADTLTNLIATVSELNQISNSNITNADLQKLHNVTAIATELNVLDGITATTTELNYTDGVTSNIQTQLDNKVTKNASITSGTKCKITYDAKGLVTAGTDLIESDIPSLHLSKISDVTATASEVNVLDGITATTAELNTLDGITATTTELNYTDGVTSNIQTQLDSKQPNLTAGSNIQINSSTNTISATDTTYTAGNGLTLNGTSFSANVVNNTLTTSTTNALSANMGKELQDQINNLQSRGRFLALWNCATGLAESDPTVSPRPYNSGDYFIVGTVAASGGTNYRPDGSEYVIGQASTVVETATVAPDDTYFYDGTNWVLQETSIRTVSFANIVGQPSDNVNLSTALNGKVNVNAAIAGDTKCKITYDTKGLVLSGTDLVESDIPNLHLSKISDVTATATELNYTDGVTSNIQTQLDDKVIKNAAITSDTKCKITYDAKGLVTSGEDLVENDIPSLHLNKISDITATASEVNVLDGITATTTELNYTDGVTSNIQTQLDAKAADSSVVHLAGTENITGDKIFTSGLFKKSTTMDITTTPSSVINNLITFRDKNNSSTGVIVSQQTTTNYLQTYLQATNGGTVWSPSIGSSIKTDGTGGWCFSNYNPPANSSDNSIATTGWCNNQSNDLVHKSGAETITGVKTFTQTIQGTALNALWADLAEKYKADQQYEPGTLLQIGGTEEVTIATDTCTFIVSTDPAVCMNNNHKDGIWLPCTLAGRIPVLIDCEVHKGDKLYLSKNNPGKASTIENGNVVGIALHDSNIDKVEAVVKINF